MNIAEIGDKIIKESDVSSKHYTATDRMVDVSAEYLALIEEATQIGARFPISPIEDGAVLNYEDFVLVAGDQTFVRTIKDVSIIKVEHRVLATDDWECVDRNKARCYNCYDALFVQFTANEKEVFITEADAGFLRVTYERGNITTFTLADYTAGTRTPDWLPETFHPLLWLKPAYKMARFFKKERAKALGEDYYELLELFKDHYRRDTEINDEISGDDDLTGNSGNYR